MSKVTQVTTVDKISELPDDLLIKILSYNPTRDAMSACFLSKRWKFLWKVLPTLDIDEDSYPNIGSHRFIKLCRMFLQSYEDRVVTSLNLKLWRYSDEIGRILRDIQTTILEITITSSQRDRPIRLPWNLNIYQTLVVMKLQENILVDVLFPDCFQSLKSLHLTRVNYSYQKCFSTLLSACPVLEDLFIERFRNDGLHLFIISVPTLQRLSICGELLNYSTRQNPRFEINAPSLKYLKIAERYVCFEFVEDKPKLVEAHFYANDHETEKLLKFLTSVERLSIHFFSYTVFHLHGKKFHRLVHLELHFYRFQESHQILSFLNHCPNLQALILNRKPFEFIKYESGCVVKLPSSVPECLTFHLETLEWRGYEGIREEKEMVAYILENALHLNMAKFSPYFSSTRYRDRVRQKNDMKIVKELMSISKASPTCQVVVYGSVYS